MTEDYITQAPWLIRAGREDLVDCIADEFERPSSTDRVTTVTSVTSRQARPAA